uniref:Thioredoxin-like_fold domain-containing protein n=1 Tax=Caenorhabditis tropicalis TaxID=1561998 RepID=A0A1I7TFF9_9PELO
MVCCCPVTTTLVVGAIGFFLYKKFFTPPTIKPKPAIHKTDYKKDTVYLYQFKRLRNCPNLSPFCMKLEVLCRVYNIPYEIVETSMGRSRNGTLPFIELNGEHIADSDLIEIRLRQHFKIPSLPTEQEAQSVALSRMADNHLFYILIRYKSSVDAFYESIIGLLNLPSALSALLVPLVRAVFGAKLYSRSTGAIGDFEPRELDEILHRDLKVIQDSIKGKFMFGDKITPVDATVFGQLASVYYPFHNHINDVIDKDFPKILEYMERIKKEVYPNDFSI